MLSKVKKNCNFNDCTKSTKGNHLSQEFSLLMAGIKIFDSVGITTQHKDLQIMRYLLTQSLLTEKAQVSRENISKTM